jgi:glucose/arabinose dehydrogenase
MATPLAQLDLTFTPILSGLSSPVHVTHAGDGSDRLFIVEKDGTIRIAQNGILLAIPFLNITNRTSKGGEQGLLSVAFPPDYVSKGYFYVNYTNVDGDTVIARYFVGNNPNQADPNREEILLTIPQPFDNHNGGQLAFGPDGYLYIGMGDGGSGGDPQNNAQNPDSLLGKILRIDVESGGQTYQIPTSNPFLTPNDPTDNYQDEIWALGVRNPWRFSFDRQTGDLYIADVGQGSVEEIDVQPANSNGGENYGWNIMEGSSFFGNNNDGTGLVLPVAEYDHSQGNSVTGGFVYRGSTQSTLYGTYLYGDFGNGRIWGLRRNGATWENALLEDTAYGISTFGEDEAGHLYVADYFDGTIYQITAPVLPTPTPHLPTGTNSTDRLVGDAQRNTIRGLGGNDTLLGVGGADWLIGGNGADRLFGGRGSDRLVGGSGSDRLVGGNGKDRLIGNAGRDILIGGNGSDELTGGRNRDIFALERGIGCDIITDFRNGSDRLGLTNGLQFHNLDIVKRGNNTLIKVETDWLALLNGVDISQVQATDFVKIPVVGS